MAHSEKLGLRVCVLYHIPTAMCSEAQHLKILWVFTPRVILNADMFMTSDHEMTNGLPQTTTDCVHHLGVLIVDQCVPQSCPPGQLLGEEISLPPGPRHHHPAHGQRLLLNTNLVPVKP